jgi:hypothetical protein
MSGKESPVERLTLLLAKADADFAEIHERQAARMQCRAGTLVRICPLVRARRTAKCVRRSTTLGDVVSTRSAR